MIKEEVKEEKKEKKIKNNNSSDDDDKGVDKNEIKKQDPVQYKRKLQTKVFLYALII